MELKNDISVIYVSTLCPTEVIAEISLLSGNKLAWESQKYHKLMAEGLAAHPGIAVTAICVPPITRNATKELFYKKRDCTENNVIYKITGIINIPLLRYLFTLLGTARNILRASGKKENTVIICDVLNNTILLAGLAAARLKRIKTLGIVTDIRNCLYLSDKNWKTFSMRFLLNRFSSYLFLTEMMNSVVNRRNRPYTVIEGQSDSSMLHKRNEPGDKYPERICIYSGTLNEYNGVLLLAEAFLLANIPDAVLQFYGMGDYSSKLMELALQYDNIRFGGVIQNEQVVMEQIKATLLINPRPVKQFFTEHSFPSKNMEYIASGTPLLTTKLPGMPDEYLPYVYLFEEETAEGYARTLKEVLSLPREELHAKGMAAKKFAMERKNNIVQAGKLLKMIREEVL